MTLQKNHIKEETIERMRLDEEVLMDFFREYISVSVSFTLKFEPNMIMFLVSSHFQGASLCTQPFLNYDAESGKQS